LCELDEFALVCEFDPRLGFPQQGSYEAISDWDSMRQGRGIPIGIHQIYTLGCRQVETHTTSLQTNEKDFATRVKLERIHCSGSFVSLHGTIQTIITDASDFERIFNLVKHRCPLRAMEMKSE
jgi:hypothetical protein